MAKTVWTPGMARDPRIVRKINRIGRRRHVGRRLRRAALKTGAVEARFSNPAGGEGTSVGWRQETSSSYPGVNRRNVRAGINRFYDEALKLDRGQSAGRLAQDVQRSAYPDRYRQQDVSRLLGVGLGKGGGGGSRRAGGQRRLEARAGTPGSVDLERVSTFDQAGFDQAERRALTAGFLERAGRGNSILFRSGLLSSSAPDPGDFTSARLESRVNPGTMPSLIDRGRIGGPGGAGAGRASGQADAAVQRARRKLGVNEVGTSNRGVKVDRWEKSFGMVGQPWCGIFAGVVLRQAGVKGINSRIASVAAIEADARAGRGPFRKFVGTNRARRGDLLITRQGQHVAFIERVDKNGTIHVIGGNQTGGVTRGTYAPGSAYGVARVRYRR